MILSDIASRPFLFPSFPSLVALTGQQCNEIITSYYCECLFMVRDPIEHSLAG